jgi:hypothetical protein
VALTTVQVGILNGQDYYVILGDVGLGTLNIRFLRTKKWV